MSDPIRLTEVAWDNFPVPPSSNNIYATVGKRRIKSIQMKQFESKALAWSFRHRKGIDLLQYMLKHLAKDEALHIAAEFHMERSRIICLDGRIKKNDTSNRIKALHDVISELAGIDDSVFWSGSFTKKAVETLEEEGSRVVFSIAKYL